MFKSSDKIRLSNNELAHSLFLSSNVGMLTPRERCDEDPLTQPLFQQIVELLPERSRIAIEWTRYIALETVLGMPWIDDLHQNIPLFNFRFTTMDPNQLTRSFVDYVDISAWPFERIAIPLQLVDKTIGYARARWNRMPTIKAGVPIDEKQSKALLVEDTSAKHGMRALTASDILDDIGRALKTVD